MIMEKLDHGSLYKFLHEEKNSLNWGFRYRVAMNVAEGMAFLHSFEPKILHQDLKR
jgi:serine/threonine protein kinase